MRRGDRKRRISKLVLVAIGVLLLSAMLPLAAVAAQDKPNAVENMTVMLNGEEVPITDTWQVKEDRLYAPIAQLAGMFGAQVHWDRDNEEATIRTEHGDSIVLGNGVPVVYFNGSRFVMAEAPFLADGRMYVMVRDAAEMMHAKVTWNGEERSARLESVPPAVMAEGSDLAGISAEAKVSEAELLKRNGLEREDNIKAGTMLRIVVPSFFSHEAEPYTEEDFQLLAKITQVEVGNESYASQLAVANVILNRVKDPRFPDTIRDVIYSGKQFPPAHNGLLDKSIPKAIALRAAKDALNGKNNIEDAVYFYNPKVTKGSFWSGLTVIDTVGSYRFAK